MPGFSRLLQDFQESTGLIADILRRAWLVSHLEKDRHGGSPLPV